MRTEDREELREIIHAVESGAPVAASLDERKKAADFLRNLADSPAEDRLVSALEEIRTAKNTYRYDGPLGKNVEVNPISGDECREIARKALADHSEKKKGSE